MPFIQTSKQSALLYLSGASITIMTCPYSSTHRVHANGHVPVLALSIIAWLAAGSTGSYAGSDDGTSSRSSGTCGFATGGGLTGATGGAGSIRPGGGGRSRHRILLVDGQGHQLRHRYDLRLRNGADNPTLASQIKFRKNRDRDRHHGKGGGQQPRQRGSNLRSSVSAGVKRLLPPTAPPITARICANRIAVALYVRSFDAANACIKSPTRSPGSSSPTDSRINPGVIPSRSF